MSILIIYNIYISHNVFIDITPLGVAMFLDHKFQTIKQKRNVRHEKSTFWVVGQPLPWKEEEWREEGEGGQELNGEGLGKKVRGRL